MNFIHYYEKAIEFHDYEKSLDDKFSLHNLHYKNFNLNQNDYSRIANLSATNILVITEPWCGDSVAILPVVKKISEANPNWNLKLILREKNLDLMEKFLTNGNKSIPIFLFLNNCNNSPLLYLF